ncbi:hypothetical protein T08_9662 [Trichinella sp. T8]|nr:hypothetical protein T08_9662 [Trichinella sp. T8]
MVAEDLLFHYKAGRVSVKQIYNSIQRRWTSTIENDEAKQNEQIYATATRRRIYKQRKFRPSSLKIVMVASRVTLEPVEQQQLTLHTFLLFLQYHKNHYN